MRRIFLLMASVSLAVLFACGVALAVTPTEETAGNAEADATTMATRGPDAALERALEKLVAMEGGYLTGESVKLVSVAASIHPEADLPLWKLSEKSRRHGRFASREAQTLQF